MNNQPFAQTFGPVQDYHRQMAREIMEGKELQKKLAKYALTSEGVAQAEEYFAKASTEAELVEKEAYHLWRSQLDGGPGFE